MLRRAAFRANQMHFQKYNLMNMSRMCAARSVLTVPGKNFVLPQSVDDTIRYLDTNKPMFTCLYFHAAWNPICEQIESNYETFCNKNAGWTHIKVDCDAYPKLKIFFDARVEPQFLMLLNGAEIKRTVGFNFPILDK